MAMNILNRFPLFAFTIGFLKFASLSSYIVRSGDAGRGLHKRIQYSRCFRWGLSCIGSRDTWNRPSDVTYTISESQIEHRPIYKQHNRDEIQFEGPPYPVPRRTNIGDFQLSLCRSECAMYTPTLRTLGYMFIKQQEETINMEIIEVDK